MGRLTAPLQTLEEHTAGMYMFVSVVLPGERAFVLDSGSRN